MSIQRRKDGRSWAVYQADGSLLCVCLYRKGAVAVVRSHGQEPRFIDPEQSWTPRYVTLSVGRAY